MNEAQIDLFSGEDDLSKYSDGRDEMNIAEFPLAMLARRGSEAVKTMEFKDTIWDKRNGRKMERKLTLTASDKWGMTNAIDEDVLLVLVQLARIQGFQTQKVEFSIYQIIQLLCWGQSGPNYQRVRESLDRWASLTIKCEKAWWNKESEEWMDETFHVIDRVSVSRDGKGRKQSWFRWGSVVFDSLERGNVKYLDWQEFKKLDTPIAKRLYRLLDKRFHWGKPVEYDLIELAVSKLGMSTEYSIGNLKQKLGRGVAELEAIGFIKPASQKERYRKVGVGQWHVIFERANSQTALPVIEQPEEEMVGVLESTLIAFGMSKNQANRLIVTNPEELIAAKVEVLKYLIATQKAPDNAAGWLVRAVEEDWPAPNGFKTEAEQEAARVADEARKEALRVRKAAAAEQARQEEVRNTQAARALRQRVDGYLESLSKHKREALIAEILEQAPDNMGFKHQDGVFGDAFRRNAIDDYVTKLLDAPEVIG